MKKVLLGTAVLLALLTGCSDEKKAPERCLFSVSLVIVPDTTSFCLGSPCANTGTRFVLLGSAQSHPVSRYDVNNITKPITQFSTTGSMQCFDSYGAP